MKTILFSVVFGFAVVVAGTTQAASRLVPAEAISTASIVPVGFKCGLINGKLVCGDKEGGKKQTNDEDSDRPKKSKDKAIPKTCGKKVNCEAGLVKLEKPNKYGACCEAREGLPPPKCKFPGQINPPNCDCPPGTEFLGYKGCVKVAKEAGWCCRAANGARACSLTEAGARGNAELNAKGTPVTCALEQY